MPTQTPSLANGGFQLLVKTLAGVGGTLLTALICWMALSLQQLSVDVGRLVERDVSTKEQLDKHWVRIDSIAARLLWVEKKTSRDGARSRERSIVDGQE